jgi:hypothetical protein
MIGMLDINECIKYTIFPIHRISIQLKYSTFVTILDFVQGHETFPYVELGLIMPKSNNRI